ncbi:hypothetical protein H9L39_03592 [Fusarium oxysporum f. sp. albedinis]|nr:hypothetical protein H9L39_03592 [Fusarium oxysporum f. sp. albedinis]
MSGAVPRPRGGLAVERKGYSVSFLCFDFTTMVREGEEMRRWSELRRRGWIWGKKRSSGQPIAGLCTLKTSQVAL